MTAATGRKTKRIRFDEIGGFLANTIEDGDLLAIGGLFKQGRPLALIREVIRQRLTALKIISSPGSGFDVDLLIAAGCVAETFLPAVTLETHMCPSFRRAVEAGTITAHCVDALSVVGGFLAAANGVPFQPVAAWKGSDVIKYNPLIREITCPFTGEKLFATKAIRPKLALLHAQEADEFGNIRHLSTMTYADQMIARSADTVLVSVDRIVPSGDIISRPRETSIPCIYVDAVVEIPFGAHPTGSFPNYSIDEAHIDSYATYAEAARKGSPTGDANLQAYIERHVIAPQDQEGYLTTVGGDTRMEELVAEAQAL
ncbi:MULTISPECIES: CoA transferase subunit A [unclassified Hwanghaeella]|jgi:glutaconate CoA-transferase subunit A|uniref:CoA transferase subunit A n=1 Tax=unclassified Hwanghaeella TaxID=2605944 RepID=UPI0026C66D1F|tara:strand:+ start:17331 stop:18272 length:942 start_codon:yes stop_codon:yes gene_type:complete